LRVAERAEGARGGAPAAAGGHASARQLPGEKKILLGPIIFFCLRLGVAERAEGARGGAPAAAGGNASARHLPREKKYYWGQ
jgi:hypothetical protein